MSINETPANERNGLPAIVLPDVRPLPEIIEHPSSPNELFSWHHKGTMGSPSNLRRIPVIDSYETWENPGAHKRYEQLGLDYVYTRMNLTGVVQIAKQGALLSLVECAKRGNIHEGRSSESDFFSGGANSVFLSAMMKGPGKIHNQNPERYTDLNDAFIVYDTAVTDRIDWFAYNNDMFGSTKEANLATRPTPEEFMRSQNQINNPQNEMVFPHGIPNNNIKHIVVPSPQLAENLISCLESEGIHSIGNKPLNRLIVTKQQFDIRRRIPKVFRGILGLS